ncbi:MAG: hypothetical protein IT378_07375 [Sandaracinaceae bacterium]|nr:hypothetical protein [Sandaracinaceae bacterium]
MSSNERISLRVIQFATALADRCREQFPRHCSACDRRFASFEQYLLETTPVGVPVEYDPAPDDPFGIVEFANCPCGTTLSVLWEGPPSEQRVALRRAIVEDAAQAGGRTVVLSRLRLAIRSVALGASHLG